MLNKVKHNFCKKPVCNTCISLKHKIYSKFIDNSNAVLTLSCDGDLNFSSSTKILAPTTTSTTMTTTQRTTTQSLTTKQQKLQESQSSQWQHQKMWKQTCNYLQFQDQALQIYWLPTISRVHQSKQLALTVHQPQK